VAAVNSPENSFSLVLEVQFDKLGTQTEGFSKMFNFRVSRHLSKPVDHFEEAMQQSTDQKATTVLFGDDIYNSVSGKDLQLDNFIKSVLVRQEFSGLEPSPIKNSSKFYYKELAGNVHSSYEVIYQLSRDVSTEIEFHQKKGGSYDDELFKTELEQEYIHPIDNETNEEQTIPNMSSGEFPVDQLKDLSVNLLLKEFPMFTKQLFNETFYFNKEINPDESLFEHIKDAIQFEFGGLVSNGKGGESNESLTSPWISVGDKMYINPNVDDNKCQIPAEVKFEYVSTDKCLNNPFFAFPITVFYITYKDFETSIDFSTKKLLFSYIFEFKTYYALNFWPSVENPSHRKLILL
jgi:hypothetical protein